MPPSPAVRRWAVAAVLLTTVVGQAPAAVAETRTSSDIASQVRALDREVNRVSDELGSRAAAYEQAQARAARLTQRQMAVRGEVEERSAAVERSRASFGELARAAYKGAVPPVVTALLTGEPRAVADLAYVRRSVEREGTRQHQQVLDDAQRQQAASSELQQTVAARREALAAQEAADAQLRSLVARADELTAELAAAADRLVQARAADREARLRAVAAREATARADAARRAATATGVPPTGAGQWTGGGGVCSPPDLAGNANGFLPDDALCAIAAGRGHRLRTDAARAFDLLNDAHVAAFGRPVCVTDSYRSYAQQVDVFRRKPTLAATPGRSQHGWGLAVDLCGGVQTFGSEAHEWMRANADRFGWIHPRWARQGGSKPEAWHWEYVGA